MIWDAEWLNRHLNRLAYVHITLQGLTLTLLLTEDDVKSLLTIDIALEAVEEGFLQIAQGSATNSPRTRTRLPNGALNIMSAAAPDLGIMGLKTYAVLNNNLVKFYVYLYDTATGNLMALIEASEMGRVRTGAASGIATKYLARKEASTIGILGAGFQAPTQLEAVCRVRNIQSVRVFNRTRAKGVKLASEASSKLGIDIMPVDSPEECVRDSDIVITITSSSDPIVLGKWLKPGAHINAAGSNHHRRREIDQETVVRADVVSTDDLDQAKIECGDLIQPIQQGVIGWEKVGELSDILVGRSVGRTSDTDITLFESQGMALEDIVVGARLYHLARKKGVGLEISS